jgi:Domain of unknown function (DUF3850)
MIHYLKTDPIPFEMVRTQKKPFEIRFNDRNYQVGDILVMRYFDRNLQLYKFDTLVAKVLSVFQEEGYGLEKGFCVMGLSKVYWHTIKYNLLDGFKLPISTKDAPLQWIPMAMKVHWDNIFKDNYSIVGKKCIVRTTKYPSPIYEIIDSDCRNGKISVFDEENYKFELSYEWLYAKDESQLFTYKEYYLENYIN